MSGTRSICLDGPPAATLPECLPRRLAGIALGLLAAVAIMIVARRLAGALENPLQPAALVAIGALTASVAVAVRLAWALPRGRQLRLDWAMMVLTSLAVAALAGGLCLPGTPAVGAFLICTLLGAEESWAWAWYIRRRRLFPVSRPRPPAPTVPRPLSLDPDVAVPSEQVTQQLTRSQTADGAEEISGWLRLAFAAGQRTGSLHVAFCPPFDAVPELEVEQLDGPEARIKTAQLLPYGVRFDLKLSSAAEAPTGVLLQFSARTTQAKG